MMTNPHDDLHSIAKEADDVVRLERLTHHIARIREDQSSVKDELRALRDAMQRMSEAVMRLALVEERQAAISTVQERLGEALTKQDERLRKLEIAEPLQAKTSEWVMGAVWLAAGAAVMFVAGKAGLF